MSETKPSFAAKDPNIFSRGSLKLTFDLIRKKNPNLALTVRNITGGKPLPKDISEVDNKHADHFRVDLDSFQVRAVVEGLMQQSKANEGDPGLEIMAKTLMDDWMSLARKMIADLPESERPG